MWSREDLIDACIYLSETLDDESDWLLSYSKRVRTLLSVASISPECFDVVVRNIALPRLLERWGAPSAPSAPSAPVSSDAVLLCRVRLSLLAAYTQRRTVGITSGDAWTTMCIPSTEMSSFNRTRSGKWHREDALDFAYHYHGGESSSFALQAKLSEMACARERTLRRRVIYNLKTVICMSHGLMLYPIRSPASLLEYINTGTVDAKARTVRSIESTCSPMGHRLAQVRALYAAPPYVYNHRDVRRYVYCGCKFDRVVRLMVVFHRVSVGWLDAPFGPATRAILMASCNAELSLAESAVESAVESGAFPPFRREWDAMVRGATGALDAHNLMHPLHTLLHIRVTTLRAFMLENFLSMFSCGRSDTHATHATHALLQLAIDSIERSFRAELSGSVTIRSRLRNVASPSQLYQYAFLSLQDLVSEVASTAMDRFSGVGSTSDARRWAIDELGNRLRLSRDGSNAWVDLVTFSAGETST